MGINDSVVSTPEAANEEQEEQSNEAHADGSTNHVAVEGALGITVLINEENNAEDEREHCQRNDDCVENSIDSVEAQETMENGLNTPPKDETTGQDDDDEGSGINLPNISILKENKNQDCETQKL